jgi:hypothetical protein
LINHGWVALSNDRHNAVEIQHFRHFSARQMGAINDKVFAFP